MKLLWVLVSLSLMEGCAQAADSCFNNGPDTETGNFAICIPQSSCITEPVAENTCPSYPSDYACCYHKTFPGREHRGAWIATVSNIDWPISPTSSVATQQTELKFLIDQLAEARINAVYFQVRPAGDALYQSEIEPWSRYITGKQGTPPSPLWDPLAFIIEYCKPLNIEVHAWINPYRANLGPTTNDLAPNHMAILYPDYAYTYDTFVWMDPGAEVVQNRTYQVALDLVSRYDIDGLHMDDYFYPYPVTGWTFADQKTYDAYLQSGGALDKEDWRRDNVNKLIQRLNTGIHEVKPLVKFSVSPFGIYRAGHAEGMPSPIAGFDQYSEIYCDAKLWLQKGWVDVLQPQLYWKIDPPAQSYPVLLDWWVGESQNPMNRHVYAGNYLSRIDIDDWPVDEIRNQIDFSRLPTNRLRGSWGNVMFSAKAIRDNTKAIVSFFKYFIYPYPALQPPFPWLGNSTLSKIQTFIPKVTLNRNTILLDVSNCETNIHKFGIYKLDTNNHWNLIKIVNSSGNNMEVVEVSGLSNGTYSVTALNRVGQESQKNIIVIS